jgi:hypothetical protein
MTSAAMLSVAFFYCHTEFHYAECHYAERRYAECHYAGCHYAECRGAIKTLKGLWVCSSVFTKGLFWL